jgi:glyoxylase-like metal-dependent hydrolase (beta-lactamase superfamily II)
MYHKIKHYNKTVIALHIGRNFLKFLPPMKTVRCYAVDGILVDTGIASMHQQVFDFAKSHHVERAYITHHHEDHSGNAHSLKEEGIPVFSSQETKQKIATGFTYYLYHQLVWGKAPTAKVEKMEGTLETENHQFEIISAPGHCDDQTVLYEKNQGWLFSGDAFLADQVKMFRGDEDFSKTIQSLKKLTKLDFEDLFCAHRPIMKKGKSALQKKLNHMIELEENTKYLHQKGYSINQISKKLLGQEDWAFFLFTAGDLSKRNMIRSILYGAVPRKQDLILAQQIN